MMDQHTFQHFDQFHGNYLYSKFLYAFSYHHAVFALQDMWQNNSIVDRGA